MLLEAIGMRRDRWGHVNVKVARAVPLESTEELLPPQPATKESTTTVVRKLTSLLIIKIRGAHVAWWPLSATQAICPSVKLSAEGFHDL